VSDGWVGVDSQKSAMIRWSEVHWWEWLGVRVLLHQVGKWYVDWWRERLSSYFVNGCSKAANVNKRSKGEGGSVGPWHGGLAEAKRDILIEQWVHCPSRKGDAVR
jgi:hypothetical protein